MSHLQAISMYSGIGGLDLAASYAGFNIIAQVEQNSYCRKVLAHHARHYWPNATQFVSDETVGSQTFPEGVPFMFGGFPCQPFSGAGSRKGHSDDRNRWTELQRIISEIRPRAVLLENVPRIATPYEDEVGSIRPGYATVVVADLATLGYVHKWHPISAADAGAGHIRERWWLVAYAQSQRTPAEQQSGQPCCTEQGSQFLADSECHRYGYPPTAPETRNHRKWDSAAYQQSRHTKRRKNIPGRALLGNAQKRRSQKQRPRGQQIPQPHGRKVLPLRTGTKRRRYPLSQSRMGATAYGLPAWLVDYTRPALQGEAQFEWEPPRTLPKEDRGVRKEYSEKIKAIGNAVFVPTAFALMVGIRLELERLNE